MMEEKCWIAIERYNGKCLNGWKCSFLILEGFSLEVYLGGVYSCERRRVGLDEMVKELRGRGERKRRYRIWFCIVLRVRVRRDGGG